MKLIIDIDDKRIKGIKLLAKEQNIATPYPTLEQIIANGIPLDKIRAEIAEYKDDKVIHYERNEMIDIVLGIIDKYRERSEE